MSLTQNLHRLSSVADFTLQIHHVESEQWLGGLLNANDQLVHSLMSFEQLDRSIAADSDSDDEIAEQAHMYRSMYPS
jgi:LAS seventeen-binding protein 5